MSNKSQEIQLGEKELKILKRYRLQKLLPASTVFLAIMLIIMISLSMAKSDGYWFLICTFLALLCGYVVFRFLTSNHDKDIYNRSGLLYEVKIEDKVFKQVYEPGSASLGGVFNYWLNKKLGWFRYENKRLDVYYIVIEGERIDLKEEEYNRLTFKTHLLVKRAKETNLYLGFKEGIIKFAKDS